MLKIVVFSLLFLVSEAQITSDTKNTVVVFGELNAGLWLNCTTDGSSGFNDGSVYSIDWYKNGTYLETTQVTYTGIETVFSYYLQKVTKDDNGDNIYEARDSDLNEYVCDFTLRLYSPLVLGTLKIKDLEVNLVEGQQSIAVNINNTETSVSISEYKIQAYPLDQLLINSKPVVDSNVCTLDTDTLDCVTARDINNEITVAYDANSCPTRTKFGLLLSYSSVYDNVYAANVVEFKRTVFNYTIDLRHAPRAIVNSSVTTASVGDRVSFTCNVLCANPSTILRYEWYFDLIYQGNFINRANDTRVTWNNTYTIDREFDELNVVCRAKNGIYDNMTQPLYIYTIFYKKSTGSNATTSANNSTPLPTGAWIGIICAAFVLGALSSGLVAYIVIKKCYTIHKKGTYIKDNEGAADGKKWFTLDRLKKSNNKYEHK